ncbi:MAG: ABC transporter substrate-binding protein [Planctomycetota bacterium]|jgi:branched-chain amino acid transport system substrate-binding protein
MINRIFLLLFTAAIGLFATGCTGEDANLIVIGFAGPLGGVSSAQGEMCRMGIEMHVEEINVKGGINGKKIKLIVQDDQTDPTIATQVAQRLASNPSVCCVLGHFNSKCTISGRNIYNKAKVPQLSYASTNAEICIGHEWTFRNIYKDTMQGIRLARFAKKSLKLNKVAVFFHNDDYGKGLRDSFIEEAKKLGLDIVNGQGQGYTEENKNFDNLVDAVKASEPGAIVICGLYQEAAAIANSAKKLGVSVPILGGDGVYSDEYVDLAKDAAKNTYVTCPFVFGGKDKKANEFKERFFKKYSKQPDCWAAQAYDALGIYAKAIEKVGADRAKIRDYLASMNSSDKAYRGITGPTYFDPEGDVKDKPIFVAKVNYEKKDFEFVE